MGDIGVTNKKHFEVFRKEVLKWIHVFGLLDWDVIVEHGGVDDDNNAAECAYNITAKSAIIRLSKTFTKTEGFTLQDLREAAAHEVCELLLCHFGYLAESRYTTYEQIETVRHSLIARLLNYLFRKP